MSHKDFVLIASALARATQSHVGDKAALDAIEHVADSLAYQLAKTNPRFDRGRFLAAASGNPLTGRDKARA